MEAQRQRTSGLASHAARRSLVTATIVLACLASLATCPASVVASLACKVHNVDTGISFSALQVAVDAAKRGGELAISGLCQGGTVIDKDLDIRGVQTADAGRPTLSGGGTTRTVIIKEGARVELRGLVIRDGSVTHGLYGDKLGGAGIRNHGSLVLRDVVVRDNHAIMGKGGGVFNSGTLNLDGATVISGNSGWIGGGVFNRGTLVMNDASAISGNTVTHIGGGVEVQDGTLVMNDTSRITRNRAQNVGGGVSLSGATLVMHDSSRISGNAVTEVTEGAGAGGLNSLGSTRRGVVCAPKRGANVFGNSPDDCQVDQNIIR